MTYRDPRLAEFASPAETNPLRELLTSLGIHAQVVHVLRAHGVTLEHLVGPSRLAGPSTGRKWLVHVLRHVSAGALSWHELRSVFRRKDHSTLIYLARRGAPLVPGYGPMPVPTMDAESGIGATSLVSRAQLAAFLVALADHQYARGCGMEVVEETQRIAGIVRRGGEEAERQSWTKQK